MIDRKDIIQNDIQKIENKLNAAPRGEIEESRQNHDFVYTYTEDGVTNEISSTQYFNLKAQIEQRKAFKELLDALKYSLSSGGTTVDESESLQSNQYFRTYTGSELETFIAENTNARYSKKTFNRTLEYFKQDTDLLFQIYENAGSAAGVAIIKKIISSLSQEDQRDSVFIDVNYEKVLDFYRQEDPNSYGRCSPGRMLLDTLNLLRRWGYKNYFLYNAVVCKEISSWYSILKLKRNFTNLGLKIVEAGNMFTLTMPDLVRVSYDMDEYHVVGEEEEKQYYAEDDKQPWECVKNITGEDFFRKYVVENLYYSNFLTEDIFMDSDPRDSKFYVLSDYYEEDYFHDMPQSGKYAVPESLYLAVEFALYTSIVDDMPDPNEAKEYLISELDKFPIAYYKALRYIIYEDGRSRLSDELIRLGIFSRNEQGGLISPLCLYQYIKNRFLDVLASRKTQEKSKISDLKNKIQVVDAEVTTMDEESLLTRSTFFTTYVGSNLENFLLREDYYGNFIESTDITTRKYIGEQNKTFHWIYEPAGSGASIALLKKYISEVQPSGLEDWAFIFANTDNVLNHYRQNSDGTLHDVPSEELKRVMLLLRKLGYKNFLLYDAAVFTGLTAWDGVLWLKENFASLGLKIIVSGMYSIAMRELLKSDTSEEYVYDKNCYTDRPQDYYSVPDFVRKGYSADAFFKKYVVENIYYSYSLLRDIQQRTNDPRCSKIAIPDYIPSTDEVYNLPDPFYDVIISVIFMLKNKDCHFARVPIMHGVIKSYTEALRKCNKNSAELYSTFDCNSDSHIIFDLKILGVVVVQEGWFNHPPEWKVTLPTEVSRRLEKLLSTECKL